MKTVQIELPDKIASELETLVNKGWFADENEIIHMALAEFVRRYRFALQEQFQLEDIAWAIRQKQAQS